MKKIDSPIIIEETFDSSVDMVWGAITEHEQMIKWYFDNIPDFKAEVGFRTQFNVKSEERNFLHKWHVTEIITKKKITYNWQYKEYPGSADVEFELIDLGDSTKLQLKVIVLEDFPNDIPEFKRESCIGGWNYFLRDRLKQYLENN